MSASQEPHFANGKICYLMIPAINVTESSTFYHNVFGWNLRKHDDGSISFDDGVNEVSGMWVTGVKPQTADGISIHIMVDDIDETSRLVASSGGEIVKPVDKSEREWLVSFRDPAGNILSLYQHRG